MILRTNPFEDWLFEDKIVSDTLLTKSESVREIGFALKGNIDNVIEKIENKTLTNAELKKCINLFEKHANKFEDIISYKPTIFNRVNYLQEENKNLKIEYDRLYSHKLLEELNHEIIQNYYRIKIDAVCEWFKKHFHFKCQPKYIINSLNVDFQVETFGGINHKQAFKETGGGWHYGIYATKKEFDEEMSKRNIKFNEEYCILGTEENIKNFEKYVMKFINGINSFSYNLVTRENRYNAIDKFVLNCYNIDNLNVNVENIIDGKDRDEDYILY